MEAEEKYNGVMDSMQEAAAEYKEVLVQYDLEFEEKGQQMSDKLQKVRPSQPALSATESGLLSAMLSSALLTARIVLLQKRAKSSKKHILENLPSELAKSTFDMVCK